MTATTHAPKAAQRSSKPKRSNAAKRENRTGWAFMAPFALLFAFVFILPIGWAIYSSFFRQVVSGGGAYGGGELVNQFVGLENFRYVITSGDFWAGVGRVVIYTLIQVPIMIIAALALAMIIDSFVVKHISGFRLGYFLPYAIPGVVASIIWVYLYNGQISPLVKGLAALGINVDFFADNIVLASMANITTWTFTGYNMLIFLAALQAIPHDLYEAARIDGANGWQIAMKIKLPNVRSAALLAMLLSIVGTIQLFNEPQIMQTADPGISKSFTPMMMAMNTSQGTLTPSGDGPASAVAIMMALIAGVLAMAYALVERKVNEE
ncbi:MULTISPECIES: carbohydrate ABC transporter permease [Bifidobacterium]|uniref:Sugar ABC transporter permease n=1 Tax=Bifidobacterium pullorum subsp. gallinarum TaxID=78344 RepID=A0A921LVW1_9BIFI|nr:MULTISPECIES: sugar ABC transporter permease [Bifidobacterium]MBM6695513.1 sugar ABC transporter permease [Bifidobacterium pullorum subsp. saeculare]MBM6730744.1 sugar ABC transporter permease [Bifidobacterium pullorum subsp. saeculare]HJG40971.1 sugar ABC transporter permease [Bifidobacterium pullorum subsp. gallinarum]